MSDDLTPAQAAALAVYKEIRRFMAEPPRDPAGDPSDVIYQNLAERLVSMGLCLPAETEPALAALKKPREPIYDEVYFAGVDWLNRDCGDPILPEVREAFATPATPKPGDRVLVEMTFKKDAGYGFPADTVIVAMKDPSRPIGPDAQVLVERKHIHPMPKEKP